MLISILTKIVSTSCIVTMMLFLHLYFKPPTTLTTYPLSLHDALPISLQDHPGSLFGAGDEQLLEIRPGLLLVVDQQPLDVDRKSTRLNSSHRTISYAVFCLKKKNYFFIWR